MFENIHHSTKSPLDIDQQMYRNSLVKQNLLLNSKQKSKFEKLTWLVLFN
jgi:hypothetical protein